ncbi:hypothetical protein SELMODRAFT_439858 [Selaginella moellendorffii]|uniref:MBD domain-containing protein n=1 Tax=Selaginella moellendorffii TaxID=88036 RepID=D8R7U5_SELML|nr:methyl-CpG-binding domain-containing protein 10 [Selaginella moellendorffii]EFJ31592.1 hypothetical protein SELMODRAFT_439858 [Selaginella moellendorffii]|eukprot:XP_024527868.1 methyl-CpG-binding domain-containing protein 10 [Selaginella moellendorffii]
MTGAQPVRERVSDGLQVRMERKETLAKKNIMAASEEEAMAAMVEGDELAGDGIVWEELPAPPGWKKKVAQRRGGTPRRGDITFVAPDGEEIKSKRQLERYLKANSGGPPVADFDWGTGETPRRSERLSSRKRPSDSWAEAEPTTPRRGRKKKAVAAIKSPDDEEGGVKDSDKADENGKEEQDGGAKAEAKTTQDEATGEETAAAAEDPAKEDQSGDQAKKGAAKASSTAPVISCAKTETMAKSQEAQPAQIGVSS